MSDSPPQDLKEKQKASYAYKDMSNLVLKADRRLMSRSSNEPTGEAESLWGKLDLQQMGDRAAREAPDEELKKLKADVAESERAKKPRNGRLGGEGIASGYGYTSVLDAVDSFEGLSYRPKTRETKKIYGMLLHFVELVIGDQSQEMLRGATDEILKSLKNQELKDFDKKSQIEKILGEELSSDKFTQLINLGEKVDDFIAEEDVQKYAVPQAEMDESGVAVVFDENEQEDELSYEKGTDLFEVLDEGEEFNDLRSESGIGMARELDQDYVSEIAVESEDVVKSSRAKKDSFLLDQREVDAFWLQRMVSKYEPDAVDAHKLTEQIMEILGSSKSIRECENRLVQLLNYEKFDLVKLLTKNKDVIYWTTLLSKADPSEKPKIISQMTELGIDVSEDKIESVKEGASLVPMEIEEKEKSMAQKIAERTPRAVLDLDSLSFSQGSHFMSNKKCILPEGSFKTTKKGYEEITIPAPKASPFGSDERLIPINSLPDWSQKAFKGAKSLNRVQSKVYPVAFESDENMLLCAPTGAGKTNVAMLTVLRELSKHRNSDSGDIYLESFKIIYIAPMKALVQEMVANFSNRLTDNYGIKVAELTGDRQLTKQQISETQIIVTTPEKWDIITRKSADKSYIKLVSLVIIDEVHLLHDERGPVLEAIVARTIREIEKSQEHVRLVGLSATLPNYVDVATFMRVDKDVGLFHFDGSFRPCPLEQQYVGITEKKVLKKFQVMNEVTYEKCANEAGKNQVLIFVHSRKETIKTAKTIRDMAIEKETIGNFLPHGSSSKEILQGESEKLSNQDLADLLPYGFAVHHAGMKREERTLVEELFADKHIQVLVSTATLAWGVNLPAHTVIIKGTQVYSPEKGQWTELSPQDVLQMLGRAGRPQFDTYGEGAIITSHSELQFYLSLLNIQLPIESQLISRLADMMNAEIVLGTIRNREEASEWLGYTYLYIRMLKAPETYGISESEKEDDPYLEQKRLDLAHTAATILDKSNMIKYDRKTGRFQVTELGRIASYYYISHKSMATYNKNLRPFMSFVDLFRVFALSEEFKFIPVREEEKLELQKLLERVPMPVKEGVDEPLSKVNVLLQSYISQLKLEGFALISDMVYITQSAGRLLRAIFEICLRRGWARLCRKALILCQCVDHRMWSSMSPLRQFPGVSTDLLKRLEKKEFPWERMYDLNPQELGELVRNPKAGKLLYRLVHQFPKLEMQAHVQPITRTMLKMELTITPDFIYDSSFSENKSPIHNPGGETFWIFVEDCDGEKILYSEQFVLKPRYSEEDHHISFTVQLTDPLPPNYFVTVLSDRWIKSETKLPVSFKHLILPAKFPPHTELLDLQPLPISSLRTKEFVEMYESRGWKFFNPIQTQCFNSLYMNDDNIFVGAPSGSGKTACAELAVLRLWGEAVKNDVDAGKVVYVCPAEEVCKERFLDWKNKFGEFGKTVSILSGENSVDLKLLARSDLIIATPENWDRISRRWKQRKNVQKLSLLISDETHLIGGENGSVLEVIISRTRFMAAQLEKPIRIVALSVTLGNAKDLGEWIGCGKNSSNIFNFHPNVRPIPMEVHLQSFTIPHFASLMLALVKPAYLGIRRYCCDKDAGQNSRQAIVFVPNRKQSKLTSIELSNFAYNDNDSREFIQLPGVEFVDGEDVNSKDAKVSKFLQKYLDLIEENAIKKSLYYGIGYIHEAMSDGDKKIVLKMYQKGWIKVLVASREMCWGLYDPDSGSSINSHLSIIMNVQYYEGREHHYVDYSLSEVLKMCGKACRGDFANQEQSVGADGLFDDGVSRVLLLVPQQKKEFYKKFLYEGLPVESHLDHFLHDNFNAEIVTQVIENKQDAVDYITWTYLYRRLAQNPNYYNLSGITHQHLSDHLSEMVENTLNELAGSKCITIDENEMDVSPLNLGMIAAYYYIHYLTIEIFSMSLTPGTKIRGLLEIICSSAEFSSIPMRHREEVVLGKLYERCPIKLSNRPKMNDPHSKALVLLQSHFSRIELPSDLSYDLKNLVLNRVIPLVYACVDVLSSSGYLKPAIAAMELCQMIVQAMWGDRESPLRQLPYFDRDRIEKSKELGIENIFDLLDIDDESIRDKILSGLEPSQIAEVAEVANRYPNIELQFNLGIEGEAESVEYDEENKKLSAKTSDNILVDIELSRDEDEEDSGMVGPVVAPFFPKTKDESWWLVVGDENSKQLLSIKRFTMQNSYSCQLDFAAPDEPGEYQYKLYFMCDSWVGCDQEYEFSLTVEQNMDIEENSDVSHEEASR